MQTIHLSPSFITNPMVMGNNDNENSFLSESTNEDTNIFFSELIINENQSFVSEQSRGDDMVAYVKQTHERENNNSENVISDQSKDPDIEMKTRQTKKKTAKKKKKRKKNNPRINISEDNKHRCKHDMINIQHSHNIIDKKLIDDEFPEIDKKMDYRMNQLNNINSCQ